MYSDIVFLNEIYLYIKTIVYVLYNIYIRIKLKSFSVIDLYY